MRQKYIYPRAIIPTVILLCSQGALAQEGTDQEGASSEGKDEAGEAGPDDLLSESDSGGDQGEEPAADLEGEAQADLEEGTGDMGMGLSSDRDLTDEPESGEEEEPAQPTNEESKILEGTWTKRIMFSTDDGLFRFRPSGSVQPLFTLAVDPDAEEPLTGTGFSLKRGRLGFETWLFKWAHFYLDAEFATGVAALVDYFVDIDPFEGVAVLRAGRFRPFFSRQFLMNVTRLMMIEYAQAWQDETLGLNLARDLGAALHGVFLDGLEYGVGIWNGERDFDIEDNFDFEMGGRVAVHPLSLAGVGEMVLIGDESDSKSSDRPGLVIGAAALYGRRHGLLVNVGGLEREYYDIQLKLGADLALKYAGLTVIGEFFIMKSGPTDGTEAEIKDAVARLDLDPVGLGTYMQIGYFIVKERVELAGRFDMVDEDIDVRGMRFYPGFGGTFYGHGHNLKVQLMYRLNLSTGYEEVDPGYLPTTHQVFLMLQASI